MISHSSGRKASPWRMVTLLSGNAGAIISMISGSFSTTMISEIWSLQHSWWRIIPRPNPANQHPAMTFPTDFCVIIDFRWDIAHDDFILLLVQKVNIDSQSDVLGRKILRLTSQVEVKWICFCNTEFFNQISRRFWVFYPNIFERSCRFLIWSVTILNSMNLWIFVPSAFP